jgi:endogenous inhibitor of DNA gyrase (YacG/DUF329 family)
MNALQSLLDRFPGAKFNKSAMARLGEQRSSLKPKTTVHRAETTVPKKESTKTMNNPTTAQINELSMRTRHARIPVAEMATERFEPSMAGPHLTPCGTSVKRSNILLSGRASQVATAANCPSCQKQWVSAPGDITAPGEMCCPRCKHTDKLSAFNLTTIRRGEAEQEAASSAPSRRMDDVRLTQPQVGSVKQRFHVVNGEVVEVHADLAAYMDTPGLLGTAWAQACGRDPGGETRASQKMNSDYAKNLRRSAVGGGHKN